MSAQAPAVQGLDLFEQYEASGELLIVTSDASALRLEPGDFIVRRAWATAAEPAKVNRARRAPVERPVVLNPEAIGDPEQVPIVQLPPEMAAQFERTRCPECGLINHFHADDCSRAEAPR